MSAPPPWVAEHLRPGEAVAWWGRPSLVGLVPITASLVGGLVGLALSQRFGYEEPGLLEGRPALALAVLGLFAEFMRRLARLRFTTYVVTDQRIYAITRFFATDARGVPLSRVSRVALRRGPIGALLGLWTARVGVYGEERAAVSIPAIRDGEGLLRELAAGQRRGCDAAWLLRGD